MTIVAIRIMVVSLSVMIMIKQQSTRPDTRPAGGPDFRDGADDRDSSDKKRCEKKG